tara:strand:+ start:64 stop:405 length:342 start_codon:yes stop_codon:yes gene_type:complete
MTGFFTKMGIVFYDHYGFCGLSVLLDDLHMAQTACFFGGAKFARDIVLGHIIDFDGVKSMQGSTRGLVFSKALFYLLTPLFVIFQIDIKTVHKVSHSLLNESSGIEGVKQVTE